MSNVLAALVGGLGAGARSLGTSRMVEDQQRQQQQFVEQQRMNVLKEQEAARRRLGEEADARDAAARLRRIANNHAVAKKLGLDLPPELEGIEPEAMALVRQAHSAKRDDERRSATNLAYFNTLRETGRLPKGMTEYNPDVTYDKLFPIASQERSIDAREAAARLSARLRPEPTSKADPIEAKIASEALLLTRDRPDGFGGVVPGLAPAEARRVAEERVRGAFGQTATPAARPMAPGATLLRGLGVTRGAPPAPAAAPAPASAPAPAPSARRAPTEAELDAALAQAGGDPVKAREILRQRGY